MKKEEGFYFIPKKWLGDANVIAMDWDCRAMHLHLIAIAWQQPKKGFLLYDDSLLRKLLGNPEQEDWLARIKPQILSAWHQTMVSENGVDRCYITQPSIIKDTEKSFETPVKKTRKTKKTSDTISDNPEFDGFNLSILLDAKPTATILHEQASSEEKNTIWTLGVKLVKQHGDSDAKARGFIAKLIKEYGDKAVAESIAQLSLKTVPPAEMHSYLIGMLKKRQTVETQKRGTGKGMVSI